MRFSNLFGRTLRQAPADAEMTSHKLLVRAGFMRQLSAGIYSYLPLGWRVMRRIEAVIREEMDCIEGQEIRMPVLNPAELWKQSKRWYEIGPELFRFQDRTGRDLVLAMTHEEVVTDLARREVNSYRQLPFMTYQIQTKLRDEPRPRAGLVRLREFVMKDAYSFHVDERSLGEYYPRMYQAYINIFRRVGLQVEVVQADSGMMGGAGSHEFMLPSQAGEDTLIKCQQCDYAANAEKALCRKECPSVQISPERAPREVATPAITTINALSDFLSLPKSSFLKVVLYECEGTLAMAVIRGDLEVNEAKLARALRCPEPRIAADELLAKSGVVGGFASPVGATGVRIVLDDSVLAETDYVAGANKSDAHLVGVRWPRDFRPDVVADIALAQSGHSCAECGGTLASTRGIELGHTFKLGTKYSEALDARYLGPDGHEHPMVMGCYGIGLDRLMAAIVEQNHDDAGIVWPAALAPFQVHLIALGSEDPLVSAQADLLLGSLQDSGLDVLYDDRSDSAGVKFKDADLIGIPLRVTLSARTLASGSVELKGRSEKAFVLVPPSEVVAQVKARAAF